MTSRFRVSILLVQRLEELRISPSQVLRCAGLPTQLFNQERIMVTTEELFRRFPQFSEGQLSKLRAHLVSKNHLIHIAEQLDLGRYLRLGRGEEKSGGRGKAALLVDALEAVLAGIYLDGGLEAARRFVLQYIVTPELDRIASNGSSLPVTDYKSALQEKLQAIGRPQPSYVLVKERGPEHSKTFTVEARLQPLDHRPHRHQPLVRPEVLFPSALPLPLSGGQSYLPEET